MNTNFEIKKDVLIKYLGTSPTVTIPQGVKKIRNNAFSECDKIDLLSFENNKGKILYIENSCFKNVDIKCIRLYGDIRFKETTFKEDCFKKIFFSKTFKYDLVLKFLAYFGSSLEELTMEKGNFFGFESKDNVLYSTFLGEKELSFYPPKKKDEVFVLPKDVVTIDYTTELDNKYIKTIVFPEHFEFLNVYIDYPNLETVKVLGTENILTKHNFKGKLPKKIICTDKNVINVPGVEVVTFFEERIKNCNSFKKLNNIYKTKNKENY